MLIQAIDIDHPPGMGMADDIPRADCMVYIHAAIVTTAAIAVVLVDALTLTD
jgi:chorismate synthase